MRAIGLKRGVAVAGVAVVVISAGTAMAASSIVTDTDNVHLRVVKSSFEEGFAGAWHTHPGR